MRSTDRRIVAAGAVVTGLLWVGTGTAAAGPPADRGNLFPTVGAAYASLPAPDGDFYVHLSVFDGRGGEATAGVEVFGTYGPGEGEYFECFDGPLIGATLDGLDGATAEGSTTLVCGGPALPGDGAAHVTVDVEWEAYGPVDRSAVVIPGLPCVSLNKQRAAEVTGLVTITVALPEREPITATIEDGFGDVRTLTDICPRGRG
ncbi:hypothetical protein [Blastococcus saxobsidens]|uniref:Uncharacterized protein n=1 Tax=Blastococcus saxobsidens TaxID=138336 RepID=A0A4V2G1X5_9ACTN|nr:hypothetical protein [Blastococcus saxobsidens]RZU30936.1 hypothetical protein BKA19_0572 [Blastococcus saxobsidens]